GDEHAVAVGHVDRVRVVGVGAAVGDEVEVRVQDVRALVGGDGDGRDRAAQPQRGVQVDPGVALVGRFLQRVAAAQEPRRVDGVEHEHGGAAVGRQHGGPGPPGVGGAAEVGVGPGLELDVVDGVGVLRIDDGLAAAADQRAGVLVHEGPGQAAAEFLGAVGLRAGVDDAQVGRVAGDAVDLRSGQV